MPLATTPIGGTEKFDLKSLPGGFVELRRMTHGEKMTRRGLLSKAKMETGTSGSMRERRSQSSKSFTAELELMNEKVTCFEFARCIVSHNLTYLVNPDDTTSEAPLDFRNPDHVRMLDGRVGEEIDELITDFNNWDVDVEEGK